MTLIRETTIIAARLRLKNRGRGALQKSAAKEKTAEAVSRKSVCCIRKKSNLTSTLDSGCELSLVSCAGACYTAGQNLAALAHITAETRDILIIDVLDFVNAERANFLAALSAVRTISHNFLLSKMSSFILNQNYSL